MHGPGGVGVGGDRRDTHGVRHSAVVVVVVGRAERMLHERAFLVVEPRLRRALVVVVFVVVNLRHYIALEEVERGFRATCTPTEAQSRHAKVKINKVIKIGSLN